MLAQAHFPGTPEQVGHWIAKLGLAGYTRSFLENEITGEELLRADHDMLRALNVHSVGHRLRILTAMYNMKVALELPFEDGDYVSEHPKEQTGLKDIISQQSEQPDLYTYVPDVVDAKPRSLPSDLIIRRLNQELDEMYASLEQLREDLKPVWELVREPQDCEHTETLKPKTNLRPQTPQVSNRDVLKREYTVDTSRHPVTNVLAMRVYIDPSLNRKSEPYKTVHLSNHATINLIIPEVLRKYKLWDDPQNYEMIVLDRDDGSTRRLETYEWPLDILRDMPNARFVLKRAEGVEEMILLPGGKAPMRPLRIDTNTAKSLAPSQPTNSSASPSERAQAVAVYEYNATLADELDVSIGDRFVIARRCEGWCEVEKDGRTGWVPSGCLAEMSEQQDGRSPVHLKTSPLDIKPAPYVSMLS
ncbi:uncharacterized protein EV422DRAFT_505735 [Fimicolochytrium jonesii]|uniref:uncharacterized protein n=1 Tax=Fimicolochytrium jonesii TaxID=1396493 RepID=UPI0022FE6424|nr:uncharacterized protein EV422DRAFT_505735 [Fimicolochytrium jonesii]KAI8822259.1 hypothetical protein EV422DRAFT_505735 [Fimicolochytrium jonesii]